MCGIFHHIFKKKSYLELTMNFDLKKILNNHTCQTQKKRTESQQSHIWICQSSDVDVYILGCISMWAHCCCHREHIAIAIAATIERASPLPLLSPSPSLSPLPSRAHHRYLRITITMDVSLPISSVKATHYVAKSVNISSKKEEKRKDLQSSPTTGPQIQGGIPPPNSRQSTPLCFAVGWHSQCWARCGVLL